MSYSILTQPKHRYMVESDYGYMFYMDVVSSILGGTGFTSCSTIAR